MSLKSAITDLEFGLAALPDAERLTTITDIRRVVQIAVGSAMSPDLNDRFEAAVTLVAIEYKTRGRAPALAKVRELLPYCPHVAAICAGLLPES